jgi:hypothetical protein
MLNNLFDTDEKHDNDMIIMTKRFSSRKKGRTSITIRQNLPGE